MDVKVDNEFVNKVVNNCQFCAQRKLSGIQRKSHLHISAQRPFEKIALDIAGPLPISRQGNKYLLSIIDVFSRFIVLAPLSSLETKTVTKSLKEKWFNNFGLPDLIISDGGTYFTSVAMQGFLKSLSISHHITSPYHPSSNGLVERSFYTIKDRIYATCAERRCEWDECLHLIELGLRSSPNITTGVSPFKIIYGFMPRIFEDPLVLKPYHEILKERKVIRENVKNIFDGYKQDADEIQHKFKVGDIIMIRSHIKKP